MPLPDVWLLHPAVVHYPLALLTVGFGAQLLWLWLRKPAWLNEAVSWLLWLGTASVWAALGLGLVAEETAPHVPPAWQTLADHKEAAFWAAGLFTALSILRWLGRPRNYLPNWPVTPYRFQHPNWDRAFTIFWLICAAALIRTAYLGGEVVFTFGMGVKQ